jgi:hypothetical protein
MSDITQKLVDESNHHGGGLAELLEAAASEIDLLRDEKADLAKENTALRERVKRMEEALQCISKTCGDPFCTCCGHDLCIAQAALKEGE